MLIDIHTHTAPLSDDSKMSLPELVLSARKAGLDGVCLTEHERFWDVEEAKRLSVQYDFLVLPGVEINTDEGHLLVFGVREYLFGMHHASFLKTVVDEAGGAMVLAHPFRRNMPSSQDDGRYLQEALEQVGRNHVLGLVDAVETANGRASEAENAFSQELSRRFRVRGCGGSDAHCVLEVGLAATFFQRRITSLQELIAELRGGRFRTVKMPTRENTRGRCREENY